MKTLRCLIADIPQKLLADILQTVTEQNDNVEVVGRLSGLDGLTENIQEQAVDVLILGVHKKTSHYLCLELLEKFPELLIIALVDDGRVSVIYLSNPGSNQLVDAIFLSGRWAKAGPGVTENIGWRN